MRKNEVKLEDVLNYLYNTSTVVKMKVHECLKENNCNLK